MLTAKETGEFVTFPNAVRVSVPSIAVVWIAFVGSLPTDNATATLPALYIGPSKVFGKIAVLGVNAEAPA